MEYKILNKINNVSDIKLLSYDEQIELSKDVRNLIIETTSKNGGHLASSLGAVDLIVSLLAVFDFDNDKIVFDVGHQTYAYKILTDRKNQFSTIRKFGGLSGFPKRSESKYDYFDTGHSSTSISAGLGFATARDLQKENYNVVAVIGDGALTGGMAFEALNNVSNLKSPFIIIVNDNGMSISKNIGGVNKALLGIRTSKKYSTLKYKLKKILEKSALGLFLKSIIVFFVNVFKQLVVKEGMFFENLNINYVGPIDGHNIKELKTVLEKAKSSLEPIIIHIKTVKGKGYKPAENNPIFFHGISPFCIETGALVKKNDNETYSKIFVSELVCLAKACSKIVAITAAMTDGTGLSEFEKNFKDRFFDVGICEQHAVTFAAGLSAGGLIPVVCIYSTFLQRAYDQIVHDVCLQNLHVIFAIDRAGLVGEDGETHHGVFDISYLMMIPNICIMAPKNSVELKNMLDFAVNEYNGPIAIRYPRGTAIKLFTEYNAPIEYGKSEIICEGNDIAIFAIGSMFTTAWNVKTKLEKHKISVCIVNLRFAKPIDYDIVDEINNKNIKKLIIMEDNVYIGGVSEMIEAYIENKKYDIKCFAITIPDAFIKHGDIDNLKKSIHIDSDSIVEKVLHYGK